MRERGFLTGEDTHPRASGPALMVDDLWAPDLRRRALPHGLDDDTAEMLRDWRAARDAKR